MSSGSLAWYRNQSAALQVVLAGVVLVATVVAAAVGIGVVGLFTVGLGDPGVASHPGATFAMGLTDGDVYVRHAGGDDVAADRLVVEVGDDRRPWAEVDDDVSPDGTVDEGAEATLADVPSGTEVRLLWQYPNDEYLLLGEMTA